MVNNLKSKHFVRSDILAMQANDLLKFTSYKTITSQNAPSEAQVKNFLVS